MKTSEKQNHFIVRKDGSLLTPEFRVSFPRIFSPNDDGKYGLGMIFDRDTDFGNLDKLVQQTITAKWGKNAPKNLMLPVLDGDDSQREEYEGHFYINGKCGKYRPGVIHADKTPLEDEEDFYPGCWARATITCYAWQHKGKAGVSVNVRNLQKLRDDEPLIGRMKAEDDFDAVAGESDHGEDDI